MSEQSHSSKMPLTLEELLAIPGRMTRSKLKNIRGSLSNSQKTGEDGSGKAKKKPRKAKTKRIGKSVRKKRGLKKEVKKKRRAKGAPQKEEKEQSQPSATVRTRNKFKAKKRKEPKKRVKKKTKSKRICKKEPKLKRKKAKKIRLSLNTQSILQKIMGKSEDLRLRESQRRGSEADQHRDSPHCDPSVPTLPNALDTDKPSIPNLFPGVDKIGKRSMATETLRNWVPEETLTNNHSHWKNIALGSLCEGGHISVSNGFDLGLTGFQFKSGQNHKRLLMGKNGFTLPQQFAVIYKKFKMLDFLLWAFQKTGRTPTLLEVNSLIAGQAKDLKFVIDDIKNIISVFSEFCKVRAIFYGNPISNLADQAEVLQSEKPFVSFNDECRLNNKNISLFRQEDQNDEDGPHDSVFSGQPAPTTAFKKIDIIALDDLMEVQMVPGAVSQKEAGVRQPRQGSPSINSPAETRSRNRNESLLRIGDNGFIMDYLLTPMMYSSHKDLEIRDKLFFNRLAEMAVAVHDQFLDSCTPKTFDYPNEKSWHCDFNSDWIWNELGSRKEINFKDLEQSREFFTFNVKNVNKRIQENEEIRQKFVERFEQESFGDWMNAFSYAIFDQIFGIIEEEVELEHLREEDEPEEADELCLEAFRETPCKLDQVNQISDQANLWMMNPSLPLIHGLSQPAPLELTPAQVQVHSQQVDYPCDATPSKPNDFDFNQNYFANSDYKNALSRRSRSSRKENQRRKKSLFNRDEGEVDFLKTEKKSISVKWSVSKRSEKQSFLISPLINRENQPSFKRTLPTLKKKANQFSSSLQGILKKIISKQEPSKIDELGQFMNQSKTPRLKNLQVQKAISMLQNQHTGEGVQQARAEQARKGDKDEVGAGARQEPQTIKKGGAEALATGNGDERIFSRVKNKFYFEKSVTMSEFSISKLVRPLAKRKSNQLHPNSLKHEIAEYFQKKGFKTVFLKYLMNHLQKVFKNSCKIRLQKLIEDFFNKNYSGFKIIGCTPEKKMIKPLIPNCPL